MVRTQIYLTDKQRDALATIARNSGKKQSAVIREAIERLIERTGYDRKELILSKATGIWQDRADLPDFRTLRSEWDK
jgi:hypothetical protein